MSLLLKTMIKTRQSGQHGNMNDGFKYLRDIAWNKDLFQFNSRKKKTPRVNNWNLRGYQLLFNMKNFEGHSNTAVRLLHQAVSPLLSALKADAGESLVRNPIRLDVKIIHYFPLQIHETSNLANSIFHNRRIKANFKGCAHLSNLFRENSPHWARHSNGPVTQRVVS